MLELFPDFLDLHGVGGWIAIAVLLSVMLYWYGMSSYAIIRDLPYPGPRPWPFIGNLADLFYYGGFQHMLLAYFKKYGRVHKMYIGRRSTITVTDPDIIKQIFVKEFDKFPNRPRFVEPRPPADSGLFVVRDEDWKRIRHTLTPTFTALKLKKIVPVIEKATETLKAKIAKLADTGETGDAISLFSLYALDVILNAAFGIESDVQNNPNGTLIKKAREALQTPLYVRFFSMFPFWKQLSRFVDVLPTLQFWAEQARIILDQRKGSGTIRRGDLVQLMLDAREEKIEGMARLSDDEIIAQSITFLVAGHETTGSTLSNLAFLLINNPDVQDKLIKELDKAREERGDLSLYDFYHRIPYLDQVINEVLRLCSPGFNLLRECKQECTINGVHFPVGVDVSVPVYTLHRDPEIWGKNPEKFDPEHFSEEAKEKRHPYAFLPFGSGPHQCIGMRFALMEIKIGLLQVLEHFRFERAPETRPTNEQRAVLIMSPIHPIYVRFSRR